MYVFLYPIGGGGETFSKIITSSNSFYNLSWKHSPVMKKLGLRQIWGMSIYDLGKEQFFKKTKQNPEDNKNFLSFDHPWDSKIHSLKNINNKYILVYAETYELMYYFSVLAFEKINIKIDLNIWDLDLFLKISNTKNNYKSILKKYQHWNLFDIILMMSSNVNIDKPQTSKNLISYLTQWNLSNQKNLIKLDGLKINLMDLKSYNEYTIKKLIKNFFNFTNITDLSLDETADKLKNWIETNNKIYENFINRC